MIFFSTTKDQYSTLLYGTVLAPYGTVRYRTWGHDNNSPEGTLYKVKSCPHWGPGDVARLQRFSFGGDTRTVGTKVSCIE